MLIIGGESLIDLVPVSAAPGAERVAIPGGSPYNCAIALAKLGNETGFLCPISTDEFGELLLAPLAEVGIALLLEERVAAPTSKAIVTFNQKMQASYVFERGADRAFTRDTLLAALPANPSLFQIGGFCPIEPDDAAIWLDLADAAAARGATISIDPNLRPSLVSDLPAYIARLGAFLDRAHLVKLSDEDLAVLDPAMTIEEHAAALLARPKCELVVITLGEKGSRAFSRSATASASIYAPPVFGDTVGAGDSLMAGILSQLHEKGALAPGKLAALDRTELEETLRFGAIVAGLNCSRKGCKPPSRAEVDAVLART